MDLKTIGYIVFGLLVALMLGFFILPVDLTIERALRIEAPPEAVYPHLIDLAEWDAWEPWQTDPIGDTSRGVGAMRGWPGGGVLRIDDEERDIRLHYVVEQLPQPSDGLIELKIHAREAGTVVVWTHHTRTGYLPGARLAGWVTRAELALQIDDALKGLKTQVER